MAFRPKKNRILEALAKGQVPLGMQIYTGNPSMIEILAYTGFDFYMLDMEHSRVNVETMEHCIRAADAAVITTVVMPAASAARMQCSIVSTLTRECSMSSI